MKTLIVVTLLAISAATQAQDLNQGKACSVSTDA